MQIEEGVMHLLIPQNMQRVTCFLLCCICYGLEYFFFFQLVLTFLRRSLPVKRGNFVTLWNGLCLLYNKNMNKLKSMDRS